MAFSLLWIILWIILLIPIVAVLIGIWIKRAQDLPDLPGPPWTPILGHTLVAVKAQNNFHNWVLNNARHFKRPYKVCMFNSGPFIQLAGDPSHIQHLLKDKFHAFIIPDRRIALLKELFGDGIFASNGDVWRLHRKAASHIFTLRNLRDYMSQVLEAHGKQFIALLNRRAEGDEKEKEVEMQTLYFRYTMDSFSEIAFGESTNSLEQDTHPFSTSFDRVQRLMVERFFDPFWSIRRLLRISAREQQIKQDIATLEKYAKEVIAKRRRDDRDGKTKQDLISQFLTMANVTKDQISDKELRDIILNFMIAGRDTTACALTWITYEFTQHPDVEKKVLEEIQSVFGSDWEQERKGEKIERESDYYYHRVSQLEYTEIVILETLRLHPPVAFDDREAIEDNVLPDGTKVPKGCSISFNPYANNRSQLYWGESADTFDPTRWLDEDGKRKEVTPFAYPTFSAGPRICLGKGLALLEIKLLLSLLLPRFHFELKDKSYEPQPVLSVVFQMKPPGLPVIVHKRNLSKGPI